MSPPLIVQKYGGTTVGSIDKMKAIAGHIVATRRQGFDLVVVVSAMDKTTDRLVDLAREMTADPERRELDLLVATGEITSMALLAMALRDLGEPAISLSGGQCGILTNDVHSNARILEIDTTRLRQELAQGSIVVVAGYQGVNALGELTTLGRGGSDTTATALAAALGADSCQIFTDVDAVYSADPRIVETARPLSELSGAEMEEMAWHGAQVVKAEAVEFAKSNAVDFEVLSPYGEISGTRVRMEPKDGALATPRRFVPRRPAVAGVTGREDLIRLRGNAGALGFPGLRDEVFDLVANYDLVFGKLDHDAGAFDLLLSDQEIPEPKELLRQMEQRFGDAVSPTGDLGAVSLIGFGIGSRPAAFLEAFRVLEDADIEVRGSFTGRESLSFLVAAAQVRDGMHTLHQRYIESQEPPTSAKDFEAKVPEKSPERIPSLA